MVRIFMTVILLTCVYAVQARMYQWVDPDTGTTQLSGKPPYWYRNHGSGPRVIVFDNGKVIDDTGIELAEAENERLRQEALIIVERDRLAAMEKMMQARRQKATLDSRRQEDETPEESMPEPPSLEEDNEAQRQAEAAAGGPTAEDMRALIDEYEQTRTRSARGLVETVEP